MKKLLIFALMFLFIGIGDIMADTFNYSITMNIGETKQIRPWNVGIYYGDYSSYSYNVTPTGGITVSANYPRDLKSCTFDLKAEKSGEYKFVYKYSFKYSYTKPGDYYTTTETRAHVFTYNITVLGVTAINIPGNLSFTVGESYTFSPTLLPSGVTSDLTWSSSNPQVATISAKGVLNAKGVGTTNIICRATNGVTATCEVTVNPVYVTSIALSKTSMTMETGTTQKLTATITPSNATNKTLSWRSSNENVAYVNSEGVVSAITPGTANIIAIATDGSGKNANCVVTVKNKQLATGITLNKTSATIWNGDKLTLKATVTPSDASQNVTWKSSNINVATVSNGVVTGIGKGTATITATTADGTNLNSSCNVTVNVKATGIALDITSTMMVPGETLTLSAIVAPNEANQDVTWKSDNSAVATVSNGVITAKATGTSTITATTVDGTNISTSCIITVGNSVSVDDFCYIINNDGTTATLTYEVKDFPNPSYSSLSGDIKIPSSITYKGKNYIVTGIGDNAFNHCDGITSITIPNTVTTIGLQSFGYCIGLTNILIPSYVTSIGKGAFIGCSGLTSVTIPNSVTSIGKWAFSDCFGLMSIKVESGNMKYDSRDNCNAIIETSNNTLIIGCKTTTIHNSVISIGDNAFENCKGLKCIAIPNSVTSIGNGAFSGCSGLTDVTFGNSVINIGKGAFINCSGLTGVNISDIAAWCNIKFVDSYSNPLHYAKHLYLNDKEIKDLVIPNSVTSIRNYVFSSCSGLTSVTIPSSVTSIGDLAFEFCGGLTSVTIPNSVTTIGSSAFYYCDGLTSVTIGNSVTSIGNNAFSRCIGLTSVNIPNSVISIGESAFAECYGLRTVYIGSSVTSIGHYAFYYSGLMDIKTFPDPTMVTLGNLVFWLVPKTCTLHVLPQYLSAYKAADQWKEFNIVGDLTDSIPGDLNGDGIVNAGDISEQYSAILRGDNDPAFDVNGDGSINAGDISEIYRVILNQ